MTDQRCPTCGAPCYAGYTCTTLMGWRGGDDPNWHTTDFVCMNQHQFDIVRKAGEPDRPVRPTPNGENWGPCYSPPNEIIA